MRTKIKLLFVSASPAYLRSDREFRDIQNRIKSAPSANAFEIAASWATQPGGIADALLSHQPQIVHFSGHGKQDSGIFLEDEQGRPLPVTAEAMCRLFEPLRGITRIVLLNACETRPIAEALLHLVDYVISMRRPITDEAAIVFASGFYGALAHGATVRTAFHLGLAQLDMNSITEADIPDLLERPASIAPDVQPGGSGELKESPERSRIEQTFSFWSSPVTTFNNNVKE